MLTGHIPAPALATPWILTGTRWTSAGGVIEPYIHPALEAFSLVAGERRAFVVREKARGRGLDNPADVLIRPEEFERRVGELRAWPLDVVVLILPWRPGEPVVLRSGAWSVAPLYLLDNGDGLRLHWDAAQLYPHLRQPADFSHLAFALRHMDTPYSRRTLFPEMRRLTERAEATWQPGKQPTVAYPLPMPHSLARRLISGADVLGTFDTLMQAAIARWLPEGEVAACELSGGLDSSTVAVVAASARGRPLRTYGLVMPGAAADEQMLRRTEVVLACGSYDTPLAALPFAPFHGGQRSPEDAMVPWSEYYHEAFRMLLARVRADGRTTILRGIGGDEISQSQPGEEVEEASDDDAAPRREVPSFMTKAALEASAALRRGLDPAPPGIADRSVYEAMAASSTVYLRSGIWPYYPYATPELVEFCRRLPAEWRLGRVLQRRYLCLHDLSERVWNPQPPETFLPVMEHGLRTAGRLFLETLFGEPRLAEMGLVSRDALLDSFRRYCTTGDAEEAEYLLTAACLEATLRAVEWAARGGA